MNTFRILLHVKHSLYLSQNFNLKHEYEIITEMAMRQ